MAFLLIACAFLWGEVRSLRASFSHYLKSHHIDEARAECSRAALEEGKKLAKGDRGWTNDRIIYGGFGDAPIWTRLFGSDPRWELAHVFPTLELVYNDNPKHPNKADEYFHCWISPGVHPSRLEARIFDPRLNVYDMSPLSRHETYTYRPNAFDQDL